MADYQPALGKALLHAGRGIPDYGLDGEVGIIKAPVYLGALGAGLVSPEGDIVWSQIQGLCLQVIINQHEAEVSALSVGREILFDGGGISAFS